MSSPASAPIRYRFAEYELNVAARTLTKRGLRVKLQPIPFQALALFLERPGELITRDELQHRLWQPGTFVDFDQGLNVAIKKLRDALGEVAGSSRYIETVAGEGYRWIADVQTASAAQELESINHRPPTATDTEANGARPSPSETSQPSIRFRIPKAAAIGMFAAIVVAALWVVRMQKQYRQAAPIHSLAVLPLRNLSSDPGQDYLADGVTEELITDLAQSLPLRVVSRTSVMRYRETSEPIAQIARELGVEAIIEGAVARSGNHVAVTVQLIDAREDRHLWAQKYDREIQDLLPTEAELSQEIASQIGGTLTSQNGTTAKLRPVDPEVYELCLMGRYEWNKRTAAGLQKAIDYFQQAIQRNPNYAPAYAGLANAYIILPSYASIGWDDNYSKGAAAARRALELDDRLAEADAALGFIDLNYWGPRSRQSEQELRRAMQLNPNYATAHHWFAYYLFFAERHNEALAEMEVARQLDPLSAIINADEGNFLYAAGRNSEARTRLRKAIDLDPNLGQPHETLALLDVEEGHNGDALREARLGLALDPNNPRTRGEGGYVLAVTGHRDEARKLLESLTEQMRHGLTFPSHVALIHIGLGQHSEALDILEKSSTVGAGAHAWRQWRIFEDLKNEPRYQKLLAEALP
ncbi:MAG TPA: winged helix-turn-helix domain-containing protein [Terriglobales bacterium]|nr:winged helix-turn-helix domain-containing protein [Terriglobales bacterium]